MNKDINWGSLKLNNRSLSKPVNKIQERNNKRIAVNDSRIRTEKVTTQAEYSKANKQMKKSIKADKQKYAEDLTMTVENAAR